MDGSDGRESSYATDRGDSGPETESYGVCVRCGTKVNDGSDRCPSCGGPVRRACTCGWELTAAQSECPNCGTPQAHGKVRRSVRRKRSSRLRSSEALRHAALGALGAIAVAGLLYAIVTALAASAVSADESLPTSIGQRLVLAGQTVSLYVSRVAEKLSRMAVPALIVLGIAAIGAVIGLVFYVSSGRESGKTSRRDSRKVRRKRRR